MIREHAVLTFPFRLFRRDLMRKIVLIAAVLARFFPVAVRKTSWFRDAVRGLIFATDPSADPSLR